MRLLMHAERLDLGEKNSNTAYGYKFTLPKALSGDTGTIRVSPGDVYITDRVEELLDSGAVSEKLLKKLLERVCMNAYGSISEEQFLTNWENRRLALSVYKIIARYSSNSNFVIGLDGIIANYCLDRSIWIRFIGFKGESVLCVEGEDTAALTETRCGKRADSGETRSESKQDETLYVGASLKTAECILAEAGLKPKDRAEREGLLRQIAKENTEHTRQCENGRSVNREINRLVREFQTGVCRYGHSAPEVEKYVAELSDRDFRDFVSLPAGMFTKIHYSAIRKRRRTEMNCPPSE